MKNGHFKILITGQSINRLVDCPIFSKAKTNHADINCDYFAAPPGKWLIVLPENGAVCF
jgi:hypothetical protein